jgi:hypothetical protein
MVDLRVLCEKYIQVDDDVKRLYDSIDNCGNEIERRKYVAEYLKKYMEREDFKSGMRRQLIFELVEGIGRK